MDPIIITSTVTALATTVATKSLDSPLRSLNDLWDGTVGHTIAAWSEKRRIQAFHNVDDFKQDLADEVNKVPAENIQEPQMSIVGPTLEASKYYMDEEELRVMFAKLIASSMDSRKNGYVRHSFVEIIKQLTPLDAKILISLDHPRPIVNINKVFKEDSKVTAHSDFFLFPDIINNNLSSISISNLSRLGLIKISYSEELSKEQLYESFDSTNEYLMLKRESTIQGNFYPEIEKGRVAMTNFGVTFVAVCLS